MARSYASSNCERDSRDYGEAIPITQRRCGNQMKVITSWTNENHDRRFWLCPNNGSRGCEFIEWFDLPMCNRSKKIIPELLKKLNKQDEVLKAMHLRLRLAETGARTMEKSWFKSRVFKVLVLVIIVVSVKFFNSSGMDVPSNCKPVNQLL